MEKLERFLCQSSFILNFLLSYFPLSFIFFKLSEFWVKKWITYVQNYHFKFNWKNNFSLKNIITFSVLSLYIFSIYDSIKIPGNQQCVEQKVKFVQRAKRKIHWTLLLIINLFFNLPILVNLKKVSFVVLHPTYVFP